MDSSGPLSSSSRVTAFSRGAGARHDMACRPTGVAPWRTRQRFVERRPRSAMDLQLETQCSAPRCGGRRCDTSGRLILGASANTQPDLISA